MANTKKSGKSKTTKSVKKTASNTRQKRDSKSDSRKKNSSKPKTVKSVRKVNASKSVEKNNGKVIALVVVLVIFFGIIFVVSNHSGKGQYSESSSDTTSATATGDAQTESENIKEEEQGELTNIGINDYIDLKKGSSYAIIYIGRPTCSHCTVQQPIMKYMVYKYGVVVNYLNTDELSQEELSTLQKSDSYFDDGLGTPLILIVKDDEIVDKSEGETSIEDLTELFKKYNLITEE